MLHRRVGTRSGCKSTVSLCILMLLLTSCASPYVAYDGPDAAKLRVSQTGLLTKSFVNMGRIDESGQCGKWFQLHLHNTEQSGALRAGIPGAAHESDRSHAEVSLQPGNYAIRFNSSRYPFACSIQMKLNFKPEQLYWAEIAGLQDKCQYSFKQSLPNLAITTSWWTLPRGALQAMDYDEIRSTNCRLGH